MDYVSTRNSSNIFKFKDVFIKGLADDGGLFIPKSLQKYKKNDLFEFKNLIKLSYQWTFVVASLIYFRFSYLPVFDFKYLHFFLIVSIFVPFIYQVIKPKVRLTSSKLGHYLLTLAYISIPFT